MRGRTKTHPHSHHRVLGFGPNIPKERRFCPRPKASCKCGSSSTCRIRTMVSPGVCEKSESTRAISRNANAGRLSLPRSNADRTDGEWTTSRSRRTVPVPRRCGFGHNRRCASLRASTIMRSEVIQHDKARLGMAPQNSIGTLVPAVAFTLLYGRLSFRAPVSRQRGRH